MSTWAGKWVPSGVRKAGGPEDRAGTSELAATRGRRGSTTSLSIGKAGTKAKPRRMQKTDLKRNTKKVVRPQSRAGVWAPQTAREELTLFEARQTSA